MSDSYGHVASDEISVLRDVQMAQEIGNLAALGVFPKGVLVYGLVYYQHGKRQYMISEDPAKLISFLNQVENIKFFPTPMEEYSERLIIPEGEEENITKGIKLKLARQLQAQYPAEVFALLEQLCQVNENQQMEESLFQYRKELESVFNIDKIKAFRDLCTRAYLRKQVSEVAYQQLIAWCEKRLAQLADYMPPMGRKEKVFYGLAVLADHKINRCIINANLSCIYQEQRKLEQQGHYATAWHEKIFTMEQQGSLRGVNQEMTSFLETIYDDQMIDLIAQMEQLPSAVSEETSTALLEQLKHYGAKAEALGRYYGRMWGITAENRGRDESHAKS